MIADLRKSLGKSLARPAIWIKRRQADAKSPECALLSCAGPKTIWERLRRRHTGTFLHGKFYCQPRCLETELVGQISRLRAMSAPVQPANRIPLGLLMVARGKLTHIEVRAALEAQRRARYGKIGEWFEKLGFATEQDVTAALALQWGCPVVSSMDLAAVTSHGSIPLPILEAFHMLPINYAATTNTLYVAFGERVDHAALYAIERILDCRTQACVAPRASIACELETMRQASRPDDVEFVTRDLSEMSRITSSYVSRLSPEEVCLSRIGGFIWLRLKTRSSATNLLFCMPSNLPGPKSAARLVKEFV
ncbi:MAG: hypothetical protein WBQ72_19540 [Terriglobales bacterium]